MHALYCCWRKQKQKILSNLKEQTTASPKAGREDNQAAKGAGQYANQRCYKALRKVVWFGSQPASTRRARHHYTIIIYQASHGVLSSMTELQQPVSTWLGVKWLTSTQGLVASDADNPKSGELQEKHIQELQEYKHRASMMTMPFPSLYLMS